ncbi:MAG: diguanylate cyclase [Gammaproteobacteria bacterium]|jgi:diguanylate cyclase (GGDEF)-like protein|nr:diguanylate cyclase [Gammaproteobacteria bacterium]
MATRNDESPLYDSATFAERSKVLDIVLDHVPQGIVVVGRDYRLLAYNKPIEPIFKLTPGTFAIGADFRDIINIWARENGQDEAMRRRALAELDLREPFSFELEQLVQGEPRWMVLTHTPLPGGGFVRTFTDITEHKRLTTKLLELSRTDDLTGLLNRRTFFEVAAAEVERAVRHGRPLVFMSLDLDLFKQINDSHGHPTGDRVLQAFAETLTACLRKSDIIGRIGGEEFAVVLPELDLAQGREAALRILEMVRALAVFAPDNSPVRFTASIGLAALPGGGSMSLLLQQADKALYRAKRDGRDCCRVAEIT